MSLFTIVPEAFAIVVSKGVYKQAPVYERNSRLFVKYGSGFIYLSQLRGTSVPSVRVDELLLPFEAKMMDTGFLVNPNTYKGKMKDAT